MACDSTLRLFSVNVRGLRSKLKRKSRFTYFRERKYDIICLQETYITMNMINSYTIMNGSVTETRLFL